MNRILNSGLLIFVFAMIMNFSAEARIGDTEFQSSQRYGPNNKNDSNDKVFPLLLEISQSLTRTYNYKGWLIRAAFLNGRSIRINYSKKNSQPIQKDEIIAILEGETQGGEWRDYPKSLNPLTRLQQAVQFRDKWINSNADVAYIHGGGYILTVDSFVVEKLIQRQKEMKETNRKASIPKF